MEPCNRCGQRPMLEKLGWWRCCWPCYVAAMRRSRIMDTQFERRKWLGYRLARELETELPVIKPRKYPT